MKMNKHYNELKASYLFVDIAHKVAAYQEAHPEKEIIRLGIVADYPLGDTIKEYYKTWYGYDVTDDELEEMLLY